MGVFVPRRTSIRKCVDYWTLRLSFRRKSAQNGVHHFPREVEGGACFIKGWLIWHAWISESPCVFGEGVGPARDILQRMIYRDALFADDVEFMHPTKGHIVPGEKSFQRLLGRLLGVKQGALRIGRFRREKDFNPQIPNGFDEPRFCIRRSNRIKRHAKAFLRG